MCRVTYFQFPIQSAFLRINRVILLDALAVIWRVTT